MNKLNYVFIVAAALFVSSGITDAHAVDCATPCGALELIECAAQKAEMTAEDYYNRVLFDSRSVLDGFCKEPLPSKPTGQQEYYYNNFCSKEKGKYYSYSNFVEALKSGFFDEFCCAAGTTKEQRYKELANFLSTIASETTSAVYDHRNDGFYYRYENGALKGATMADKTQYYPEDSWLVAALSSDKNLINTQIYWSYDERYPDQTMTYHPAHSPMTITFGPLKPPEGFEKIKMNEMIEPGYWCGMGATQLTKDTMVGFFGWYYNNIADGKPDRANYKDFVNAYVVDGKLGFMGTLWYWMYRVSGNGYRTPHQAVTNVEKPVCLDIACATMMVNGGCNDYPTNRLKYYQYFIRALLGADYRIEEVMVEFQNQTLENMKCPFDPQADAAKQEEFRKYIDAFLGYCRPK